MLKSVRQTGVWPNAIIKYIQGVAPATVTDPGCPKPPLATDNLSCLSKLECPLCCEILSQPIELPCSVLACAECIIAWLKISGTVLCPCCYSDIPMAPASLRPASDLIISLLHDILVHCTSCGRDMRAGAYVGHQCTKSPTRSEPITFMRVVQANSPATTACAKSLNGRCREMHKIRNVISGGEPSALLHKEASSMLSREDKMALIKEAGIVDIGPGEGLQIKAAVSITWSKMRVLRRLLKESGVSLASEVSMRKITDEMIGDNLEGEVAPFSFKMPTGGEEIRGAPLVYVPNLIQKIIQTLEEQDSSARLTWHGGFIPENEIWVKLGGDRGGGIFKATFQIVNVPNPNSVLNTCVFCCFMAGDSTYNLHVALDRYKLQVNKLQGMRWRDFTVKVFLCGDYDFYGKMYGLSGASGCYPCLFCTIHKEDMKIPLSVRGYSPTRSLQSIYENYSEYSAAGFPRKDAQFYSNCISEPIWDIPLDQVCLPGLHITQGMFTKLFDLLEASCHEWDLKLAYHYQRVSSSTFTTYSAQLQRLQAAKSELEVAKHSKETTEQLATYMVLLYGEQSNVVTQYLLQQAEEQRESVDKLISSIEALCGAMVATALREIPSILSDVMVTATTFRSILAQFGRCHELYDGNYINEYNASQLAAAIPSFMESFRRAFPKATTPIKMHLLEDHALQWANRMHVGFGLLGEQGAESIHAKFNTLLSQYNTMHDKVKKLLCIVKQHFLTLSTAPHITPPKKRKQ
ncbi:hypothetical protein EMCRGX_G022753 [Ephydatia muelleri]